MSHNNHTPRSVLDAPMATPVVVSEQKGTPRRERRHVTLNPKGMRVRRGLGKTVTIPKAARQPATNVPWVKAVDEP